MWVNPQCFDEWCLSQAIFQRFLGQHHRPEAVVIFYELNIFPKDFSSAEVVYLVGFESFVQDLEFGVEIIPLRNIAANLQVSFGHLSFWEYTYELSTNILEVFIARSLESSVVLCWALNLDWFQIVYDLWLLLLNIVVLRFEVKFHPLQGALDAELKLWINCFITLNVAHEFLFSVFVDLNLNLRLAYCPFVRNVLVAFLVDAWANEAVVAKVLVLWSN